MLRLNPHPEDTAIAPAKDNPLDTLKFAAITLDTETLLPKNL